MTFIDQIALLFTNMVNVITSSPDFQTYGVIILFFWTIIPSVKSVLPEVFSFPLLSAGISPSLLILVSFTGATIGDFVLYMLGRGSYRVFKGKNKEEAKADHFLHKYKLPIFLLTPFLGIVGDIIVVTSGIERIGFRKILPYIAMGQLIRMSLGILVLMGVDGVLKGIIDIPDIFGI